MKVQGSRSGFTGVIVAASVPMFMAALDNLVMTFALPVIRDELKATLTELQWFVNIYTLVFATLMMPMSALGDRFGRRKVFLVGIAVFTLASAGAALSDTSAELIVARAVQAIGAAAIVPLSLTIVSVASPPARRALAIGLWGGVNGTGIEVGAIIGGAVVSGLHWSAIFWINVPIGVVALIVGWLYLPESTGRARKFDGLGIVLAAVFVMPVTWAVVEGPERGWADPAVVGAFVLSAAGLIGFLLRERYSSAAFLPLGLFRKRTFTLANVASFLFAAGVFGAIFLLSQFLQVSMGYGALEAGLRATPWTLAPMFIAPLAGALVHRFGVRAVLVVGMVTQTLSMLVIAGVVGPDVQYTAMVLPMLMAGVGMGLCFAPMSAAVLIDQPESEQGVASGVNSTLRQLGIAVGIAVSTAIFEANGHYMPGQPFVDGMQPALMVCVGLLAAATIGVAALPKNVK